MSWEPLKFSSYALESAKAQALQEVNRMVPWSGSLQPAISSAEGVSGWQPVIDLASLNSYMALAKLKMETVSSVLGSIRKGDYVFS